MPNMSHDRFTRLVKDMESVSLSPAGQHSLLKPERLAPSSLAVLRHRIRRLCTGPANGGDAFDALGLLEATRGSIIGLLWTIAVTYGPCGDPVPSLRPPITIYGLK